MAPDGPKPYGPMLHFPAAMLAEQTVQAWQGPYPPPDAVERYEKLSPGAFNRILAMAERDLAAQIGQADQAARLRARDVRRGHWLAWSVTLVAMLAAFALGLMGHTGVAIAFLGVPVMSVGKALLDSAHARSRPEDKQPGA